MTNYRRIFGWVLIFEGDECFTLGAPSAFALSSFDTKDPLNLNDNEILKSPLAERPPSEITDASFLIIYVRLSKLQRRVFDAVQVEIDLDGIMAKSRLIEEFERAVPSQYKLQPPAPSDPPNLILHRVLIAMRTYNLYNRLHQYSLQKAETDNRFAESAILFQHYGEKLLDLQRDLDVLYDRLYDFHWYVDILIAWLSNSATFTILHISKGLKYGIDIRKHRATLQGVLDIIQRRSLSTRTGIKIYVMATWLLQRMDEQADVGPASNVSPPPPLSGSSNTESNESAFTLDTATPLWNEATFQTAFTDLFNSANSYETDFTSLWPDTNVDYTMFLESN